MNVQCELVMKRVRCRVVRNRMSQRWCKKLFLLCESKRTTCLARAEARWLVKWPPSCVQFETAGTDCSLHHIAQTRIPYQPGKGLFSDTGGEHETKASTNSCRCTWNSGWVGNKKNASNARKNNWHLSLLRKCFAKRCRSLKSTQP